MNGLCVTNRGQMSAEMWNDYVSHLEMRNRQEQEKLELEKNNLNRELLIVTQEVERINGEKNLLKERSKTTKEENELKEEIRIVLEKKEKLSSSINTTKEDLRTIILESNQKEEQQKELDKKIQTAKSKKNMLTNDYSKHDQDIISIKHKIDSLKNEIEQGGDMPNSVRNILKSTTLTGIHNTIGNILTIDDKFTKALNIAISSNKNFIITSDEDSAKKAINYLKDNHLGRATFFPLTVIKERYVDYDTLNILKSNNDFLGILSDLVTYDKKYKNIIENQLGQTVIAPDIDAATRLSHLIKNKYRIVTLDGDVVNVGGSMSGGSINQSKSIISIKQELRHTEEKESILKQELIEIQTELTELNKEISLLEEQAFQISKDKVSLREKYDNKNLELRSIEQDLNSITKEWESLESISNNSLDQKEQELIKLFHEKTSQKDQIQIRLNAISKDIDNIKLRLEEEQAKDKLKNATLRNLEKESRDLEISMNRLDVKLDNMLNTLNEEYELTFERASSEYKLDVEPEEARVKVNNYRANIKRIGMVNLAAIEEYERVNTRYVFLTNQREDLLKAEDTLLEIIREYRTGLLLYLNSFVQNIHTAEDLTEDTFFEIMVKRPKFSGKSTFKTWIYSIGRNIAAKNLRKDAKLSVVPLELQEYLADEESIEINYIKSEQNRMVHQALHQLKLEYRQILYLSYFENFSIKEISLITKQSEKQVKNLLYNAKKSLKSELERSGFEYEE